MVGDDDDLLAVPDLGVLAEVLLEDADGAGAANVVRHEDIDIDPDVVAGLDGVASGVAGEDLFGQGHRRHVWLAPSRHELPEKYHIIAKPVSAGWSEFTTDDAAVRPWFLLPNRVRLNFSPDRSHPASPIPAGPRRGCSSCSPFTTDTPSIAELS